MYFEKIEHKRNKKRLRNVKYERFVYDITAEENHILYVRRNGKCLWSSNSWDAFVPQPLFWKEVFRVLKPGGHIVAFYGTRTYDWGVMAMRIAGFEIRDGLQWLYGSGFPKSFNVAKKIDEILGNERKMVEYEPFGREGRSYQTEHASKRHKESIENNEKTKLSKAIKSIGNSIYEGLGTALKPAVEPVVLARKPLEKGLSIAENVIKWGTGAINIDGCRISTSDINGLKKNWDRKKSEQKNAIYEGNWKNIDLNNYAPEGRFPANLILSHHPDCCFNGVKKIGSGEKKYHEDGDTTTASEGWHNNNKSMFTHKNADVIASYGEETVEDWTCVDGCPIKIMDEQSGESKSIGGNQNNRITDNSFISGVRKTISSIPNGYGDVGGASRFFYTAKASKSEKNFGLENFEEKKPEHDFGTKLGSKRSERIHTPTQNTHPTIKPVKLMQYLTRLITPPNGKVLDPFNGSGTTGIACVLEGFEYTGLELDPEYCKISEARISAWNEIEEYEDYKKIIESQVPEEEINKYGKQTDLFSE